MTLSGPSRHRGAPSNVHLRMRPRFYPLKCFGALLAGPVAAGLFALPAASQVATYRVTFNGNWTLASTPGGVVSGAHFTTLIGGVHGSGVSFWDAGQFASPGVESVAELGATGTFRSEVAASPHTLSVIEQGVAGGGTGTATFTISATRAQPLVTLLSMIGPSPDWFVGVSGLSLLDGADRWRQSFSVDLFPYDAGTEDGTEFSLSNPDTNPQGVISGIAGMGKFSNVRMARLTFTAQTLPATEPSVSLSVSPNPVDEGQPVTVTARLSETLPNDVTIPLALVSATAESDDYGTLASITISSGQRSGTGTISTARDDDEDDETFTVSLGTLPHEVSAGSPSSVEVTILDEGPAPNNSPTVRATCQPCTVPRGGDVRLRADASDPDGDPISYSWEAAQGTFTGATDGPDVQWTAPEVIRTVVIRVEVTDGRGGTATAQVAIRVVNRSPVFESPLRYEIADNRDGRAAPIALGRVVATDPDGDDFELELAPASDRFILDAASGALSYTGPGEDFETDPTRYALTVTATDTLGGVGQAEIAVHVVNVNERPAATDDTLTVAEDRRTRVEVLLNDSDPDRGDRISVVSVGAPANGQAQVVDAGAAVEYTPAPNYHGPDRFTYVVADAGGLTDTATVQITVTPINDRPNAEDDQATTPEDEAIEIPVLDNDSDPDGDPLTVLSASPAEHGTATVAADGSSITYLPAPNYHGPDRFTYVVADAGGLADTATVRITVTPVNDRPEAEDDQATTAEDEAIRIPVLDNDVDPDGDPLSVVSVSPAGHGAATVAADKASVSYLSAPNYHGPDHFTYVVADAGGLTDTAAVRITVTPVNDGPIADDDQATTREDEAIMILVLDNDVDPDGDPLRVQSVSPAEHGTAVVAEGGTSVSYIPAPDYHGPDRFTYVAADASGLSDMASVDVTVTPINDGPAAVGVIPDLFLDEGAADATLELTPYFTDIDGDPLDFSAETSDAGVVTAAARGTALVLAPVAYGNAAVTVTATDAGGLTASQSVTVRVSDRAGRVVLGDAFAAMARSYLSSARMTLERRVGAGTPAGITDADRQSGLRINGRFVGLPDGHTFRESARQIAAGWLPGPTGTWNRLGHQARRTQMQPGPAFSSPGVWRPAPEPEFSLSDLVPHHVANPLNHFGNPAGVSGTDFTLAWGGRAADSTRDGIAWSVWGQTDVQRYSGASTELGSGLESITGGYDGDLRSTYLGLDTQLPNWLFGIALGRSLGDGNWSAGSSSGLLSTTMTSVHPYLRWSRGANAVWTTFGAGRGEARNERAANGRVGTSPLGLVLGIAEIQRRLGRAGGPVAFGLRADAGLASLFTEDGPETIDNVRGRVHQARFGLDARSEMRAGRAVLAPFGAVHARYDGGDGQTGHGMELSGGVRARLGMIGLDAQGRWLAFHSATSYGESGAGLTLTVGGRKEEGFSLSASPRWGDQSRGGVALWQDRAPGMPASPDTRPASWTMDARGAYRARLGGQMLEIATAYRRVPGSHHWELAGHFGLRLANRQ